jgi:glycine betaine/choline ABC-type transport system substrate-binding protein
MEYDDRNFYGIFSIIIIISSKMTMTSPNTKETLQKL